MAHRKIAKKEELTIRENNSEPDASIKRRETLLPSPIEHSSLQIFQSLYQSLPVPPVGSAESWLSGTDDSSPTGRGNDQDAVGNPSTPKPTISTSVDAMGDSSFGSLRCSSADKTSFDILTKRKPISTINPSADEWVEIEVTVDSGACETVMPTHLCKGISIMQSISSHGAEYKVANRESVPNLGERRCLLMTLGSQTPKRISFQVSDVHKALLSISRCADMGFDCFLGKHGGFLQVAISGEQIPLQRTICTSCKPG